MACQASLKESEEEMIVVPWSQLVAVGWDRQCTDSTAIEWENW